MNADRDRVPNDVIFLLREALLELSTQALIGESVDAEPRALCPRVRRLERREVGRERRRRCTGR